MYARTRTKKAFESGIFACSKPFLLHHLFIFQRLPAQKTRDILNKMKNSTISRIIGRVMFLACFGCWATMVFMMLYLAQFNTPNLVDDFCFAWVSKEFGVLPGAYYYYMGWSGRYFGNILMHLTPLFFSSSFTFSGVNTYLLLALGFVTNLYLVRRMTDLPFRSTRV